jgi:hypothetical protein
MLIEEAGSLILTVDPDNSPNARAARASVARSGTTR